jgi:hypothetical protein
MALDPGVAGFGIARAAKPEEGNRKKAQPTHEQHDHEPVNIDYQIVNLPALFRGHDRQSQEFFYHSLSL